MAGLLGGLSGSDIGLLAFGTSLLSNANGPNSRNAFGLAAQNGLQGLLQGAQFEQEQAYQNERAGLIRAQAAKLEQEQARQARAQDYIANLAPGSFNPQQAIQMGVPLDVVKAYAEAPNLGRSKVANYQQVRGPDGKVTVAGFDEFGNMVNTGAAPFEKPVIQNLGGETVLIDPVSNGILSRLQNSSTPDAVLSSATARRGQDISAATARRGQDLTNARALEANAGQGSVFAPTPTSSGYVVVDKTGKVRALTGEDGKPLLPVGIDASAQGAVAQSRAQGTAAGEANAQAVTGLPKIEQQANQALNTIDLVLNHPGKGLGVGVAGILPAIPGTQQSDFVSAVKQLQGQTFLQAFESLKGGGAITEVEGTKAENAIARLSRIQSQEGFDAALKELRGVVESGVERARKRANAVQGQASTRTDVPADIGNLLNKYGNR